MLPRIFPLPFSQLLGLLVLLHGATIVFFWKVLDYAIATGMARYGSASGKLARTFFSDDRELVELLQFGQDTLPVLLFVGILIMVKGILAIAFPAQTEQILRAFRIVRTDPQA